MVMLCLIIFSAFAALGAVDGGNQQLTNRYFPKNFKFGVSTGAYQIEGAWDEDGKGPSFWDVFTHTRRQNVKDGSNADVSTDYYHKYPIDIGNLNFLGVQNYRFSISWSRILPDGNPNNVNERGVQYYRNILTLLKDVNIEPYVTMFQFDIPQSIIKTGSWNNESIIDSFDGYARVLFDRFGDVVKNWLTIHEPRRLCLGLASLEHNLGSGEYVCGHNIIKAHARVYHTYQNEYKAKQNGRISLVLDSNWYEPVSIRAEDQEASERSLQFSYGWFAHPIVYGNYPPAMIHRVASRSSMEGLSRSRLPQFTAQEQQYIKGTYDFLTIDHFYTNMVQHSAERPIGKWSMETDLSVDVSAPTKGITPDTVMTPILPWGLRKLLRWISRTYGNPEIIITENGFATSRSYLNDANTRGLYIKSYLDAVQRAIYEENINVSAYMAYTLMDDFEWTNGYTLTFGLFYVDAHNRSRIPKESAFVYRDICKRRCLVDSCIDYD